MSTVSTSEEVDDGGNLDPSVVADRLEFANLLSRLRNRAGLSIRTVAKELDQPVATIGGYFSGQHLPGVSQTDLFRALLRTLGVEDGPQMVSWVDALVRVRQRPGPRSPDEPSPYPGLESFRTEDARWFFGREELTDVVIRRAGGLVGNHCGATVVVIGASGSGKSSLLRAGVVPAALDGHIDPACSWRAAVFCPGESPLDNLAAALAPVVGSETPAFRAALDVGAPALQSESPPAGILLVVDQFEETFTTCRDEQHRQQFLQILAQLPEPSGGQNRPLVVVLLGLRADFYARAAQEPTLVPALQDHQIIVGPMSLEELRRAIVDPARQAGITVNDDLLQLLLEEVAPRGRQASAHEAGVLPLLSHALRETWSRARRGSMTTADYRNTGGIAGAVKKSAEQTYLDLTEEDRTLARRVLLRLVNVDDAVTRRRARWSDLPGCVCDSNPGSDCPLHRVINRFVAGRLLTAESETVEISHEALLSAWPRLNEWIDADRDGIRLRRQLGEAARTWEESGRDAGSLMRGGRLELTLAWAETQDHRDDLVPGELLFLKASADRAEEERLFEKRRLRRFQILAAVIAFLALVAAGSANLAIRARNSANEARDIAMSRQLAVQAAELRDADSSLAMELSLLAFRISPTTHARSALLDSTAMPRSTRLLGQPGATAIATSGDAKLFAVSRAIDGTAQLFRLTDNGPVGSGLIKVPESEADMFAIAFNPAGTVVATGGVDNVVRLWDVSDPDRPRSIGAPLAGFDGAVQSLAFSPDGNLLIGAGQASGVLRWDVSDPDSPVSLAPLTGMAGITQGVAFSHDGRMVAAGGSDGVLRLWAPDNPESPTTVLPTGIDVFINSVAFSPDGKLLAAGSRDQKIRLWDLSGPAPAAIEPALSGFGSWVNSVGFSDDGRLLAGGSSDNSIRFWEVDGWNPREPVLSTSGPVTNIRFIPGSYDLLTAATDGIARVWSWPGPFLEGEYDNVFGLSYDAAGKRLAVLPNRASGVSIWDTSDPQRPVERGKLLLPPGMPQVRGTGALSPDGRTLATGMADPFKVELWDVTELSEPVWLRSLIGPTKLIEQIEFSPGGSTLAAASDDGTVRLWDLDNGEETPVATLDGPNSLVLGLAFSPNGRLLTAGAGDSTVWLWKIDDLKKPIRLSRMKPFQTYAYAVAISPDNKIMAAGSADKTIRLWDITNPANPRPLGKAITGPKNNVYSLAFSPIAPVLSAAVRDGTLWQFDIADLENPKPLTTLTGFSTREVFRAIYSPDGRTIASGDGKNARLFFTGTDEAAEYVCATSGDGITRSEWSDFLPDLPYDPPCDQPD
jgi:WD40 repeat protein